ncbi:PREDICTED: uncharacterized protein LOC108567563 [Nicrophorus vespilloides]|uniref:Uncharacterized protein LOC108567563 n=1 Tax=Nicrophorus vespilloides TaxID=110193 RepID=A0ABM1N9U1_NICVS|nr:PREDICTED: uncharacterized protein LOC108567563 [Nicrophorus vespilloides]
MSDKANSAVMASGQSQPHNKRPTILIYPTVSPETVVVPIISCILGFPLLALLVICCLRRRAKLAREQARRRNYDYDHGRSRAVSLRSERGMSRGFPSMELDTVLEERSDPEPEATVVEMITPDQESRDS